MRMFKARQAIQVATEMVDVQVAINSALTVIKSTSEWMDVEAAAKAIGSAAAILGALAERVAEL